MRLCGSKRVKVCFALLLCLFSGALTGCKQNGRVAWAMDMRNFVPSRWVPSFEQRREIHTEEAAGLSSYLAGLLAEGQGDLETAQQKYLDANRHDPENVQIVLRLGAIYLRRNQMANAARCFERIAALDASDPRPRFFLGVLYAAEGRFSEATVEYSEILSGDPGNLSALSQLADLYVLQEKLQEALEVYKSFLKERPDSAVAHFNIAVLYAKVRDWRSACAHFEESIELDPYNLEARLGLAVSLEQVGNLSGAKEQFEKAFQAEPANTRLVHYMSHLSYRMGNLEGAAEWLTRYLGFNPHDSGGYLELGYIRVEQGRWDEGIQLIRLALELGNFEEPPVDLWISLGSAYRSAGDYKQAEVSYKQALALAPDETRPYCYLGAFYQWLDRYAEAEEIYRSAYRLDPNDPQLLNAMGYLYAVWGVRLEEAAQMIERAISQDPENGGFVDSLAWVYFKMGRLEESLRLLKEAVDRRIDPEILEHLGQVYLRLGDQEAALAAWEQGLKLNPSDSKIRKQLETDIKSMKNNRAHRKKSPQGSHTPRKER